jgi:gluconate 2-dehydrogenase gamma chain
MDRRKSIKALLIGTAGSGVFVEACKTADKKAIASSQDIMFDTRMQEEKDYFEKLGKEPNFFNAHEMATITVLGDIIIPKDEVSGSASDAKVPEFIEFIVKDMPSHQTPIRGGLKWLDLYCYKLYEKAFVDCDAKQQIAVVDSIAYTEKAKPELKQGVAFFSAMRDLVATGFYTSEIGVKDVGYMGNVPNQWNGVPDDVLKQYKLAYTEKELKECVSYDKV